MPETLQFFPQNNETPKLDIATIKKLLRGDFGNADYSEFCFYDTEKVVLKGDFAIDDLVFESGENYEREIIFDGRKYKNIEFRGGNYKKIIFRRGTFDGFVSIRGGNFGNLVLLGGTFNHWLGTLNGVENKYYDGQPLADEALTIERFEIEGGTFLNNIWIEGGSIGHLEIRPVTLSKIHIKPNDDRVLIDSVYSLKHTSSPKISEITLSRYLFKDSILQIFDSTIKSIYFKNFTNNGTITISKVKLTETLEIINSDLGKTTLIDCDLDKAKLEFQSSKVIETSLNGTSLPLIIEGEDNLQKRLLYSQIKKIYENRGDVVEANRYFAKEMNTHFKTLNWIGNFWEKANIGLNKISSNHGQNLRTSFLTTTAAIIICFTLYCRSLGYLYSCPPNSESYDTFFELSSHIWEFTNPIHKADYIPKELEKYELLKKGFHNEIKILKFEIPREARFWDVFSRIIIGYFIYQFIAAFRKHGKKS